MAAGNLIFFASGLIVLVILLVFITRWMEKKGEKNVKIKGDVQKFIHSLSATALIKYEATSRFEEIVQKIVQSFFSTNHTVLLVSTASRTERYAKLFPMEFKQGDLIIVKILASSRTDRFYHLDDEKMGKKEELKGRIAEISVDWLEYLSELIESLPASSVIVFEPVSDLILINGFDKTYRFIKKTVDYTTEVNVPMISFINDEAHEESVKASFEGLFTNIAKIYDDRLEIVK